MPYHMCQSVSQSVSQSNPVQTMRPFLIPGTVSFVLDTGTPAFEAVGASTIPLMTQQMHRTPQILSPPMWSLAPHRFQVNPGGMFSG